MQKPDDEVTDEVYEARIVRPDGDVRWLKTRQHPVRDDDGDLLRIIGMSTDITEQKRREETLRRQRDQLDEFASVLSHDLRNPLNVAQGRLELAREEYDSEHLDAIARAHDRMELLIDDLLALAREGVEVAEPESVELASLIENCWQSVDTAAATLVVDSDRTIQADRSRLAQLLENLFRNAVEHGGDDVTITVGDLDDGFYVADDGPGVPETDRDQIFESGYSTNTDGTGYGLSIVQKIVDAHGWNIQATESEAGGAQFEITETKPGN